MAKTILTSYAFTVGGNTISAESTSIIPLTLNVPTSSTSNIIEFKVNNSNVARISQNGSISTAGNLAVGNVAITNANQFQVASTKVGNISAVIGGFANQTADLVQYQNSSSTILGGRNATGKIYSGSTAPLTTSSTNLTVGVVLTAVQLSSTTATITVSNSVQPFAAGQTVTLASITGGTYNGAVTVTNPLQVVAGSQYSFTATATGANTFASASGSGGNYVISPSGTAGTATINLVNSSNMAVGDLVSVNGFTGVTTYNTGTGVFVPVTAVSNSLPYSISYASAASGTAAGTPSISLHAQLSITASSNLTTGLIIRNSSSFGSGGNYLQQWQTSTGTSLLYVDPSGIMVGTGIWRCSNAWTLGSTPTTTILPNATMGHLVMQSVATQPNNTVGGGVLHVDAGILKYRGPTGSAASIVNSDGTTPPGTTTSAATGLGYMGLPQNATTTSAYTIVAADAGKHIYASATRTVTIDSNVNLALPIGTTLTFIAGSGATMTIAITSDTMYLAGPGTTGSRTLAPFGMATAVKITSTSWIISGNGLT